MSGVAANQPRRGRPPRSSAELAHRRDLLVAGAIEAVRHLGASASIDEIAGAVGVSKPVLYGMFGDKLGLADAMAASVAVQVMASVAEVGASLDEGRLDVDAVVRAVVNAMVDLIEQDPEVYGFLVRTLRAGDRGEGFFASALVGAIRDPVSRVAPAIAPDVSSALVAVLVDGAFGFLFFAVESWQARREPDRAVLVEALVAMLNGAISAAIDR